MQQLYSNHSVLFVVILHSLNILFLYLDLSLSILFFSHSFCSFFTLNDPCSLLTRLTGSSTQRNLLLGWGERKNRQTIHPTPTPPPSLNTKTMLSPKLFWFLSRGGFLGVSVHLQATKNYMRRYFLRSPGIDSKESLQSWYFWTCMGPRNRFQGMNSASLCSLAGRYNNPIPTRCLAPIHFLKIPAPYSPLFWSQLYYTVEYWKLKNTLFDKRQMRQFLFPYVMLVVLSGMHILGWIQRQLGGKKNTPRCFVAPGWAGGGGG